MGSSYGWFLFYVYCMFVVKIRVSCQLRKKPTQEFSPFLKELIYQGPLTIFLFPFWFLRIDLLAPPNEKRGLAISFIKCESTLSCTISTAKYKRVLYLYIALKIRI